MSSILSPCGSHLKDLFGEEKIQIIKLRVNKYISATLTKHGCAFSFSPLGSLAKRSVNSREKWDHL